MAKGKAKISSSEDLAPPPARLLRSRKKEAESNDAVLKGNAQASLLLKGLEEGGAAAEPLQECAVIVHQMYQAAECSCLTGPDEATKEKATNESEVISLSTAAPKSSFRSNKNQTESWAGEDAAEEGSKRQRAEKHKREVEGRREQQHSTMAFPAKKRRRMGSCGLTDGERSRVLGNYEKKPSFVKGAGMKVCNDSDTPLRSSGHESGQKQAEPKQVELQSAEPKQAELQSAEPKQAELQSAEPKQAELQSAEPKQAELQSAEPKQAELQSAGEDARAPTEAPMSVLYRGPEESNRQQAEEESISQSVNRAEGGASSTEAPTSGPALQPEETAEPGEACNGGPTGDLAAAKAAPSSGGDSHGACGCSDDVSDSQLNTIVFTEELMEDGDAGPSGCLEDATELLCGIISELSSANRRVMAAHRELQNLRRFKSKASRNSTHRER